MSVRRMKYAMVFLLYASALSAQTITVTFPNGSETGDEHLVVGTPYDITWTSTGGVSNNLRIDLYWGTNFVSNLVSNIPDSGAYNTVVSTQKGTNYWIKISDMINPGVEDWSDSSFWLAEQYQLTSPDGGEKWYLGQTNIVTWDSPMWGPFSFAGSQDLWFSGDGGTSWQLIANPVGVDGTNAYSWTASSNVLGFLSENARIGITPMGAGRPTEAFYGDYSNLPFTMAGIQVTYPSAGDSILRGAQTLIHWTAAGAGAGGVKIDFYDGLRWTNIVMNAPCTPGTNTYLATLPADHPNESCRLRVTANDDPTNVWGVTREFIVADIEILSPVTGSEAMRDQWQSRTTQYVEWASGGLLAGVNVEYTTNTLAATTPWLLDNDMDWLDIAMDHPNTNSGSGGVVTNRAGPWVIPGPPCSNVFVRISSTHPNQSTFRVVSGAFDFSGLEVEVPNGSETWEFSGTNLVGWEQRAAGAFGKIEIAYVPPVSSNDWEVLVPTAGLLVGQRQIDPSLLRRPSTEARIRISATSPPSGIPMVDECDNKFVIRGLSMTYPTNDATYNIGSNMVDGLQWYSAAAGDNIAFVHYSADGGATYDNVIEFSGLGYAGNEDAHPSWNHQTWNVSRKLIPSDNARCKVVVGSYEAESPSFDLRGITVIGTDTSDRDGLGGKVFDIGLSTSIVWACAGISPATRVSNSISVSGTSGPFVAGGLRGDVPGVKAPMPGNPSVLISWDTWDVDPDLDPTTNAVIRVQVMNPHQDSDVYTYSEPFTLRGLKVMSPNIGTNWMHGDAVQVAFFSAGLGTGATATVYYSEDGAVYDMANPIASGVPVSDGWNSFAWSIENSASVQRKPSVSARIKIVCEGYEAVSRPFQLDGIRITEFSLSGGQITWSTVFGKGYFVQRTTSLGSGSWANINGSPVYEADESPVGTEALTDTNPILNSVFYRVLLE